MFFERSGLVINGIELNASTKDSLKRNYCKLGLEVVYLQR